MLQRLLNMTTSTSKRMPTLAANWPYNASDFIRMDERSDFGFYSMERFVTHIDDRCIATLSGYYGSVLPIPSAASKPHILDLASSWISHLPPMFTKETASVKGIGMNQRELQANPVLSSFAVLDLNQQPILKDVEDGSQDAVVCSVSIDYMTKPRSIMGEIARVLKPGCWAHMAFSNRCFHTKVVGKWLELSDEKRCDMVANYFAFAGDEQTTDPSHLFDNVEILTLLQISRQGDPLYVVRAQKTPN